MAALRDHLTSRLASDLITNPRLADALTKQIDELLRGLWTLHGVVDAETIIWLNFQFLLNGTLTRPAASDNSSNQRAAWRRNDDSASGQSHLSLYARPSPDKLC